MKKVNNLEQYIEAACAARANLHVFDAVASALENGAIAGSGTAQATAIKIGKLCRAEMQKQLRVIDAAIEAAHGITAAPTQGETK